MSLLSLHLIGPEVKIEGIPEDRFSKATLSNLANQIFKERKEEGCNIRHFQGSMIDHKGASLWFGDNLGAVVCALSGFKVGKGVLDPDNVYPLAKTSWEDLPVHFVYTEDSPSKSLKDLADKAFHNTRCFQKKDVTLYATRFIHEEVYVGVREDLQVAIGKTVQAVASFLKNEQVNTLTLKWEPLAD